VQKIDLGNSPSSFDPGFSMKAGQIVMNRRYIGENVLCRPPILPGS